MNAEGLKAGESGDNRPFGAAGRSAAAPAPALVD
jgi:hypothetical protein